MKLSVIVPCYNEAKTIYEVVKAIKASPVKGCEIIIVDDGSTDGTREILSTIILPLVAKIEFHSENRGKGAALRTGISLATGDIVIIQDADLEYSPQDYPLMIQPILDHKADVVFGSRFVGNQPHRVVYYWHMLGNQFLTTLSNMFTNINLTDMETCYKAFRREIVQAIQIEENRFGFEPEITAKVAKTKCRIYEVGISYYGRTYDEGKKIGWKDGVRAIYCIFKYNLFGAKPPRFISPSNMDDQDPHLMRNLDSAEKTEEIELDQESISKQSEIIYKPKGNIEKGIKHKNSTFSPCLSQIFFLAFILTFFQACLECISSQNSYFTSAYLKLFQWDSLWYEKIVNRGYYSTLPPDMRDWGTLSNVAFFPGYPLFTWLIKSFLSFFWQIPTRVALIFAAQVACSGFWLYFLLILKQWRIPRGLAIASIIMILVYPGSFYLVSAYSESFFLFALMGLIYWSGSNWKYAWVLASLSGIIMSATRIVGIPLAIYPLIRATLTTSKIPWGQKNNQALLVSGLSTLGGLSFLSFCQWRFGQWDLYLLSQRIGWGVVPDYFIFSREWFLAWIGRKFTVGLELETDVVTRLSLPTSDEFSRLAVIFILLVGFCSSLAEIFFAKRLGENNWRSRLGLYFCSATIFYISAVSMANRALSSMVRHGLPSYVLLILAIASLLSAISFNSIPQSKIFNIPLFSAVAAGIVLVLTLLFAEGILGIRFSHGQWVT